MDATVGICSARRKFLRLYLLFNYTPNELPYRKGGTLVKSKEKVKIWRKDSHVLIKLKREKPT